MVVIIFRFQQIGRLLFGAQNMHKAGLSIAASNKSSSSAMGFSGINNNNVGAIPFVFPFAPLGLGLFDADPSRILNILHHQSMLAEEALR